MKQKLFSGDLVRITDNMPKYMAHFPTGKLAIIDRSYEDEYGRTGGGTEPEYGVYVLPRGDYSAWYPESLLTFIETNAYGRLPKRNNLRRQMEAKKERDDDLLNRL